MYEHKHIAKGILSVTLLLRRVEEERARELRIFSPVRIIKIVRIFLTSGDILSSGLLQYRERRRRQKRVRFLFAILYDSIIW